LTGTTSAGFNVTPGTPTHLGFVQQPTSAVAGVAISPAITVQLLDANNNVVTTDSTDAVSMAIGGNPGGGTLSGTTTVTATNGVASFGDLSINKTGTGYTLKAGSGSLTGATSGSFNIIPGSPDHLAFGQQPTNTAAGAVITPAVTVQVLDVNNNLVTGDSTDQVTLTLASNPTGATLSGTTTVTVSGGVAKFSNLSINLVGTGYTLSAGSGSLKSATSASFNITSASATIEDFEHGLGLYFATNRRVSAATTTSAAHDGTYGLDMSNGSAWIFRNDSAAQIQQGETISVWEKLANVADGRAYFGFGASASGTLSVVLAPNSGQFIIQDNSGYGFTNKAVVGQSFLANHWYRVQVGWGVGGAITARLYDSNGTILLNTVQATDNNITSGGIAFRGISDDKYFDTVTMTVGVNLQSQFQSTSPKFEILNPSQDTMDSGFASRISEVGLGSVWSVPLAGWAPSSYGFETSNLRTPIVESPAATMASEISGQTLASRESQSQGSHQKMLTVLQLEKSEVQSLWEVLSSSSFAFLSWQNG
jgi:hypothetical protein